MIGYFMLCYDMMCLVVLCCVMLRSVMISYAMLCYVMLHFKNYPSLRNNSSSPGPWFENWGRMVAVHPALSNEDRIQITKQLLKACDPNSKQGFIPNQVSGVE